MGPEQISIWVSERRFAPFVERAEGERALAVELYLWQARVAGASLTTVAHFEVLLRNAVDRQLGAGAPEAPVEDTWLPDPATLSPQGIGRVREVLGRLEREGYSRERSRVIAGHGDGLEGYEEDFGDFGDELEDDYDRPSPPARRATGSIP